MDETLFVPDLIARLAAEKNVQSQKSLLLALWYAATPAGRAAIKAFADRQGDHPESAAYAKTLLDRKAGLFAFRLSSAQSLREERRKGDAAPDQRRGADGIRQADREPHRQAMMPSRGARRRGATSHPVLRHGCVDSKMSRP
jgi:hypothetical protein